MDDPSNFADTLVAWAGEHRRLNGYGRLDANARAHIADFLAERSAENPIFDRERRFAVVALDPEERHRIRFTDEGWTIEHPLIERLDGSLFGCRIGVDSDAVWVHEDPLQRGIFELAADGTVGEQVEPQLTDDPHDPCAYCVGWDEGVAIHPDGSLVKRMYRQAHETCDEAVNAYVEQARSEAPGGGEDG